MNAAPAKSKVAKSKNSAKKTPLPDLSVNLAGVTLRNPLLTASGCSGYGEELANMYSLSVLGGLVTKTITPEVRLGHPIPRTAETSSGMLNAIGLANVGIEKFITEKIPFLKKQDTTIIVNVGGKNIEEYETLCDRLAEHDCVDMIEINLGCPNVKEGGMEFGAVPAITEEVTKRCKAKFPRTLIVKLTPNVTNISTMAFAAEQGGADAVSVINSMVGMTVDVHSWRPTLTFNRGGLTGPAIKPIALAMVHACYQKIRIPIIGIGGIASTHDVVEFMLCGATAVQLGTALFVEPDLPLKIAAELPVYLKKRGLHSVTQLIGQVQKY